MKDKEYYTTEDIVIPKGTRFENWGAQQKKDEVFSCVVGIGKDAAIDFPISYSDMEEIMKVEPEFFTTEKLR